METVTAIVTRSRHNEHVVVLAQTDRIRQELVTFSRYRQLTTTHVDDMGSLLNGLRNRPCEVNLRTRGKPSCAPISKHRDDSAATMRGKDHEQGCRVDQR